MEDFTCEAVDQMAYSKLHKDLVQRCRGRAGSPGCTNGLEHPSSRVFALALPVVRFDDTLVALRGSTHLKLVCGDPGPRAVRVAPLPLPVSFNDVVGRGHVSHLR